MSDTLIRVAKDGAHLSVHPTCLAAHQGAGWSVAEDQTPGGAETDDLAGKTAAELKALAAERGVELGVTAKKADIIAALELSAETAALSEPDAE